MGLGANLGDRAAAIERALAGLAALPSTRLVGAAPVLETAALLPPEDPTPQPAYLNTVAELATSLEPLELLGALKALERQLGRAEATRWAPRVIDLDLLLYGQRVLTTTALTVPHPELHRRRFVLEPLAALAPDVVHPVLGARVDALLAALTG